MDGLPDGACGAHRRPGEWRKRQTEALTDGRRLNRGERVTVKVKLNDAFKDYLSADRIGMGLETFVAWHPGALPIRNIRENVIVLTRIFHKPKRLVENPLPPQ